MSELSWAEHPELVRFYSQHRSRPEDLYPSERRFLPWLARQATSVLDTGCAAGGFIHIWRFYHPNVEYTGIDISSALIETARRLHPNELFFRANVSEVTGLPDRYASVVQALSWLHWDLDYVKAITQLWRLADRYLFMDVRLSARRNFNLRCRQKLAFVGPWDGESMTPYLILGWPPFARLLLGLKPRTILGYGYWGKPAETVVGVDEEICFAVFVLEKIGIGANSRIPTVCVDLPLAWPAALSGNVHLIPGSELKALVPLE
ncbi:MAG: hypothetical protein A3G87_06055 [Omnitrophica bacterium RIFCSPLOWO2_12_FULL_50_11]|nr:MAG: hypothetical protein A3G87_06055 [Omnitrophica bacterium RIFCSPLOWO2_12_FULL_50_11]